MMETTSKLKVPSKVWLIAGAAAVLLAVVIGIFAFSRPKATTMHLLRTQGTVAVADGEGKEVTIRENLGLYGGYQVGTRSSSFAWIDLDQVKLTKMDQDSEIQIHKEDKHLEIEVKSGGLFFNVTEPLADDETMEIRTSTMVVGIRGTCGWVVSDGEKGAQVYILEGKVEAKAVDTAETVEVSAGEMARVSVTEDGKTEITVQPFAEEYVPEFVQIELEEDDGLSAAVLAASGLDVLNPPDPAERLKQEYQEIINNHPILDNGVSGGSSYTADGVTYADEGLSQAVTLDLNGDGTEELILVTQEGDFLYPGPITKLKVYGAVMGRPVLYGSLDFDEADYMYEEYSYPPNQFWLVESNGRPCIYLFHGSQATANEHLFALENDTLTLLEKTQGWEEALYNKYNCTDLADGTYTVLELPPLPANVRQKVELQENLNSREYEDYPIYAKLADTDQDGEDEMYVLSYEFCVCDWDGTQIQSTVLESDVAYAKLIDMDQDGQEDLVLLMRGREYEEYTCKVYSWKENKLQSTVINYQTLANDYNFYREKTTGDIYVGGRPDIGNFGEEISFHSLTNSYHFSWYRYVYEKWGPIDDPSYLSPQERAEYEEDLKKSQQEWDEYEAGVNRFELIERIDPDSYEWQESLAYTVDEVRQQLMTR